ncbi:PseH, pseudaminic acid biosynthesis N-acetyl transferase [Burkholderiaceae bacterium]
MMIREALISDLDDILEWRNDAFSLSMFLTNDRVCKDQHINWFKKTLTDPKKKIYIGILSANKVGVCRFDYKSSTNSAEISINLNPSMRNKKLAFSLLDNAIKEYRAKKNCILTATIKKINKRSISIFENCGFYLTKVDEEICFYRKEVN